MIDRAITLTLLRILDPLAGTSLAEDVLMDQVDLKSPRPVGASTILDHIHHAAEAGFITRDNEHYEVWGELRWQITERGKAALRTK